MKRIYHFFARMTTRTLILIPYFLSFLCMGLVGPIGKLGGYSELIMFSLVFFMWGTAGIPMIVRKEGLLDREGRAVLFGILHLVFGWGIAFFLLIYNVFFR